MPLNVVYDAHPVTGGRFVRFENEDGEAVVPEVEVRHEDSGRYVAGPFFTQADVTAAFEAGIEFGPPIVETPEEPDMTGIGEGEDLLGAETGIVREGTTVDPEDDDGPGLDGLSPVTPVPFG